MNIHDALVTLGVTDQTLSIDERNQLLTNGYLHLHGILTQEQVDEVNARLHALLQEEGEEAGKEVHQEAGTDRLANLINKGTMFHVVLSHPRVLAAIALVLEGDLKLSSLNARAALPGMGLQALHADYGARTSTIRNEVCNSLWMLDDFTPYNGATRIVPGSHLKLGSPSSELADTQQRHPDEVLALGKAGDVVVFNAHTWHGGTLNTTDKPRRAMHGYFTRRSNNQQLDQARYLLTSTREQLSEAERVVLGVE